MQITDFFDSPSAWGIGLALLFGLVWLAPLAPYKLDRYYTWLIFLGGAVVFAPAVIYIQIPLQTLVSDWLATLTGLLNYLKYNLFATIPFVLLSGLVQEGARLVPVVIFWLTQGRRIDPKLGLTMGAMAGAGLGIFEAQWVLNSIFASGWSTELAETYGLLAYAGFWKGSLRSACIPLSALSPGGAWPEGGAGSFTCWHHLSTDWPTTVLSCCKTVCSPALLLKYTSP
jgi:hypothetical protein